MAGTTFLIFCFEHTLYFTETKCSNKYGGVEPPWTYFKIPNTLFPRMKSGSMPRILCLMLCAFWCTFNTAKKTKLWPKRNMLDLLYGKAPNIKPSTRMRIFLIDVLQNIHVLHHLNILWSYNLIHSTHQHSVFDDLHHTNIFNLIPSSHQCSEIIKFWFLQHTNILQL